MFFKRIGKVAAHLMFSASVVRLFAAFFVAFNSTSVEANQVAARRYLAAATSGEAIDHATVVLLLGIALGVLCEIASRKGRMEDRA